MFEIGPNLMNAIAAICGTVVVAAIAWMFVRL